jgi:hypothetical protein
LLAETETDPAKWSLFRRAQLEAQGALEAFLDVPTPGLWRDKRTASGEFVDEASPASSFYHIVCAIQEIERTAEIEKHRPALTSEASGDAWAFAAPRRAPAAESERPEVEVEQASIVNADV